MWFFLLSLFSFSVQGNQESKRRALGFWQAIEPFGAEQVLSQQKQAFYEIGQYFRLMDAWRASMYAPINEKPLWTKFRRDLQEYDHNQLLFRQSAYFNDRHQKLAVLDFDGHWQNTQGQNRNFDFSISGQSDLPENNDRAREFGDVQGRVELSPGSLKPSNLLSEITVSVNLGTLLFTEILESIEAMNSQFQRDRLAQYRLENDSIAGNDASNNALSAIDKALLARFFVSLPSSMETLSSVSRFEQFVSLDTTPKGEQATRINHRQRINLKGLKREFPDTYSDFKSLLKGLSFTSEIRTKDDHVLGRFSYDAEEKLVAADMVFVNEGFGLQNHNGEVLEQVIFPTQLETLDYKIVSSLKMSLFGLKVEVDKLNIAANYNAGLGTPRIDRNAKISMAMADMPSIDVSGAFFYLIPSWLIDLLIPGTIETLIAGAFEDLVTGNSGKGLTLDFMFDEQNNQQKLRFAATAELPYEVIQALLKIEEDKDNEQRPRLYRTMRANLRRDFAAKAIQFKDQRIENYLGTLLRQKNQNSK